MLIFVGKIAICMEVGLLVRWLYAGLPILYYLQMGTTHLGRKWEGSGRVIFHVGLSSDVIHDKSVSLYGRKTKSNPCHQECQSCFHQTTTCFSNCELVEEETRMLGKYLS